MTILTDDECREIYNAAHAAGVAACADNAGGKPQSEAASD